jgi:hypothetical protein
MDRNCDWSFNAVYKYECFYLCSDETREVEIGKCGSLLVSLTHGILNHVISDTLAQ